MTDETTTAGDEPVHTREPETTGGVMTPADELPEDFTSLWKRLQQLPDDQLLERIADRRDDAPERVCKVLTIWLAQKLGYSRLLRRKSALIREPLWDLLAAESYRLLSPRAERVVSMIADSTNPARSFLHPSAALATLAIWRHTDDEALYAEAESRLKEMPLPNEQEWLYEVVEVFVDDDAVEETAPERGRPLVELVELVLAQRFWEIAALLAGLYLVHRHGKWYRSAATSNLTHACDVASRQYPYHNRRWLELLVEAAMGGSLSFQWLEGPVEASIRLNLDDPDRQQKLREYVAGRPFDADYSRLVELYGPQLKALRGDGDRALEALFEEVEQTVGRHPARARRLLELMLTYRRGPVLGSSHYRVRRTVERLDPDEQIDRIEAWLIGLYVNNATLEPHAAELVYRAGGRVDWESNPFATRDDYETYLVISDYDRAFEQLTCKFDGVTMEHADKYAAARIKFFVHKRAYPSRIHRLIQLVFRPLEWVGSGLTDIGPVSDAIDRGMERFETEVKSRDHTREVLSAFSEHGIAVDTFDQIRDLPVAGIDEVVSGLCNRRVFIGGISGGVAGALAPVGWGALSLGDIPVMLAITVDVCSRFCWYYGFDPRNHPDLPFEILAVALGGVRPEAVEPMMVRQNLHSHVMRKSIVVGALAHGGITHLTGKGVSTVIQKRVEKSFVERAGDWAKRAVRRNFRRRTVRTKTARGFPVVGAALGAVLNAVMLYDICEAARVVLTDRFLERKYPEWIRHFPGD